MRILVACEYSGRVRDAFRSRGHDALSCDLVESEAPGPHYVGDVRDLLGDGWDMMIAFPPCTYLSSANGFRWQAIAGERAAALDFVRELMTAPIERIAIENPRGAVGSHIRPPDQYVEPWWFGEPYAKKTGLWLKGLSPLRPDVTERPGDVRSWIDGRQRGGVHHGGARAGSVAKRARSRTFAGIAAAMAEQWGNPKYTQLALDLAA